MAELTLWLSAARGLAGAAILTYASVTDLATRRVDNRVWLVAGAVGAVLLLTEALTVGFARPALLLSIPLVCAVAYLLYATGLLFGGADAKALMALAVLVPFHDGVAGLPLAPSLLTELAFPLAAFGNALLVTVFVPVALLVFNAARRDLEVPACFVGYRLPLDRLGDSWAWPMERVEGGRVVRSYMPARSDAEVDVDALREAGRDEVWVTPKLPFMVPLTVGFALAFVAGDLMTALVRQVVVP